jgi:hypothetical protein
MLELVISGGQTGADQAGLAAARYCGIPTSGWAPKGYRTLKGPCYKLREVYNLKEHSGYNYRDRTWDNVLWADATLRFASNFESTGEWCTYKALRNYNKPYEDVHIPINENKASREEQIEILLEWLKPFKILNVAGNAEETSPGIYRETSSFLAELFKRMQNANC